MPRVIRIKLKAVYSISCLISVGYGFLVVMLDNSSNHVFTLPAQDCLDCEQLSTNRLSKSVGTAPYARIFDGANFFRET